MSLVVFRREDLAAFSVEPFEFVVKERKGIGVVMDFGFGIVD